MNVGGETSHGRSQDFDLNLAPIIDCFTVLITFMLASASFLAVGVFDTAASTPSPSSTATTPPPINIDIVLELGKGIRLKAVGKTNLNKSFSSRDNQYDSLALTTELKQLLAQYPSVQTVTLSADDDVEYRDLIRMMEALKPHVATTLLGGFE